MPKTRHRSPDPSDDDYYYDDYYYSEDERRPRSRSVGYGIIERFKDHLSSRSLSNERRIRSPDRYRQSSRDRQHRHRGRSRHSESDSRSNGRLEHAFDAGINAAAVEAIRVWKEPGKWTGRKASRVATTALGAAVVDAMVDGKSNRHGKRKMAESIVGGLLANRIVNGPRDELRYH